MDAEYILSCIMEAEREAGEIMLGARDIISNAKTGARDVVTQFDLRVQKLLEARLTEKTGPAAFFCEEMNEQGNLEADRVFIIDPIDGTMNFVRGFSCSCISVACHEKGTPVCGAVYNPYLDEMFCAVKGHGAFLNGKPIHVSDTSLSESVACFGTAPYREDLIDATFTLAKAVMRSSLDLRRSGSAALDLCSVATGRAGLYFEYMLSLWDYAAGSLIVSEAGGALSTIDGSPLPFDGSKTTIVAGNPRAMRDFFFLTNSQK